MVLIATKRAMALAMTSMTEQIDERKIAQHCERGRYWF
jgi:hypothetical protein